MAQQMGVCVNATLQRGVCVGVCVAVGRTGAWSLDIGVTLSRMAA